MPVPTHSRHLRRYSTRYYCVPVPGESDWARTAVEGSAPAAPADGSSGSAAAATATSLAPASDQSNGLKRSAPACEEEEEEEEPPARRNPHEEMKPSGAAATDTSTTASAAASVPVQNHPLPGERGTACLVTLYPPATATITFGDDDVAQRPQKEDEGALRLNDVIEVVGVFALCAGDPVTPQEDAAGFTEEALARNPPTSRVPRLHALCTLTPILRPVFGCFFPPRSRLSVDQGRCG